MSDDAALRALLHLCRRAMPSAAGVVLATLGGSLVAHEPALGTDPEALAARAARERHADAPTSTLVAEADGTYLVFFVPEPRAG